MTADSSRSSEALRLMAILAHPDDESLGTGGILSRYAAEGVATHVVTATRGQRGRFGAPGTPSPGPEMVGRAREAELRDAAAVLGVREPTVLGHMDGEVDRADPRRIVGEIVAEVRRVRPQVVVTFSPDGAYGHPDHIAICQFATAAMVTAADPGHRDGAAAPHRVDKLYYMVWGQRSSAQYQKSFKRLVSKVDGVEREAVVWPDWAITTTIDSRAQWRTVWRAIQCHKTQLPGYPNLAGLTDADHEALWGTTELYRAYSTVTGGRARETDLFEGLRAP